MELNQDLLVKALYEMIEMKGFSQGEITAKSNVHNIGRIISGSIAATDRSWFRLHEAFPEHIPHPE